MLFLFKTLCMYDIITCIMHKEKRQKALVLIGYERIECHTPFVILKKISPPLQPSPPFFALLGFLSSSLRFSTLLPPTNKQQDHTHLLVLAKAKASHTTPSIFYHDFYLARCHSYRFLHFY